MALWGNVFVNTKNIGSWEAQRVTNLDEAMLDPDAVSIYEYRILLQDDEGRYSSTEGIVEHRYGDGAAALAAAVLAEAERP